MKAILAFAAFLVVLAPAILTPAISQTLETPNAPPGLQALVKGHNAFALGTYRDLARRHGNNLGFSPRSLLTTLAIAYAGARDKTAEELERVLCDPLKRDRFHEAYASLLQNTPVSFQELSGIWGQAGLPFQKSFLDLSNKNYHAHFQYANFQSNTDEAREAINEWALVATHGKVKGLLAPSDLKPQTRLVLVNAVHFKEIWQNPFPQKDTFNAEFEYASGKKNTIPMMKLRNTELPCYADDELSAVELPYRGGFISFLVLLPKKTSLSALESKFDSEYLDRVISKLVRKRTADICIPRFSIQCALQLRDTLLGMGITAAFSDDADFSGIGQVGKLATVIQKACIEVDERGTEAAAGTAGWTNVSLGFTLIADHPFLFLIRDKSTGSILFMGRVVQP